MFFDRINIDKLSTNLVSEFKKKPCYWVGAIIFLSLFLRAGGSLFVNNILGLFIITILLQMAFKDWVKAAIYAAIIIILMNLIYNVGYQYGNRTNEGFDNLDEALKNLQKLGEFQHKENKSNDKSSEADEGKKHNVKETKGIPVVTLKGKMQPVEEFNQLNDEDKAKLYKNLNTEKKEVKRDSAVAQRDLYQLIDTVKQLQDTVQQLGPTLKEGKKIMDAFENIKME